jgi:hypothetical protein
LATFRVSRYALDHDALNIIAISSGRCDHRMLAKKRPEPGNVDPVKQTIK